MWDFLETLGGKVAILSASILGIITFLEKISSIKLWTWLKKKYKKYQEKKIEPITNALENYSKKVDENFSLIKKDINSLEYSINNNRVEQMKYDILELENMIINGKKISLNQYDLIDKIIYEYEDKYKDFHNGELKNAIAFIRENEAEFKLRLTIENQEKNN